MIKLPPIDQATAERLRELYYELGRSLLAAGNIQESIEILKIALETEGSKPETWKIYYMLGEAYRKDSDNNQSFQAYLHTVAENPAAGTAILPLAHKLLTRATASAYESWINTSLGNLPHDENLDLESRAEILTFVGRTQLILRNYQESLKTYKYGYQIKPDDTRICEGLGESLWRNGMIEEGLEMIQKASTLAEDGLHPERAPTIAVRLVRIYLNQGQYQKALEKIEDITFPGDYSFELLVARGTCHLGLGEVDKALELAENALSEDAGSVQAKMLKIRTLIAKHEYSNAVDAIDDSLTKDPTNIEITQLKIQASIEGQLNADQAFRTLDRLLKRKNFSIELVEDYLESPFLKSRNNDGNAQYFIAKVHYHLYPHWTLKQTLEEVNRALELGLSGEGDQRYTDTDAYLLKAKIHERKNQKEDAAEAYFMAGRNFYRLNENEKASLTIEQSLKLNENQALAWWYLADSYRMQSYLSEMPNVNKEMVHKGLESWNRGISIRYPNKDESWVYLARAYICEQLNQIPERDMQEEIINDLTALAYAERALLHSDVGFRWAILARYYRYRDLNINALLASQQAHKKNPDDLTVMQELAGSYINLGMIDEAAPFVKTLIDRYTKDGNDISANYYKGWQSMLHFHKAEFEHALIMINESIQSAPEGLWNRNVRGAIYAHMHDFEHANQDYAWILERRNDPNYPKEPIYYAWATINLGFEDFDLLEDSIKYSKQALQNPDDEYDGYMNLCHIYLARSEFKKAQEYLSKALELANSPRELINAEMDLDLLVWISETKNWSNREKIQHEIKKEGGFLDQVKKRNEALKRNLKEQPQVELAIEELRGIDKLKEYQEAIVSNAQKAGLARIYIENNQLEKALETYRWLNRPEQEFPEAAIGLENIARTLMERGIEHHNSGEAESAEKMLTQSEELLVELLENNSQNDSTIHQLADHYFRTLGRPEKAFVLFKKIREIKGESNEASYQNRLGNIYYSKNDYISAIEHYQKAIEADPSQAVFYSNIGLSLRGLGKWEESRQLYRKAYEINQLEEDYKRVIALTHNGEGNEFIENEQYNEAIEAYSKAIEHDPSEAVFYSNMGLALRGLGKWEESRQYYQKAFEINKEEAEYNRAIALAHNGEGNDYIAKQQYDQAIDAYTKAIEHDPSEAVFYANIGLALRGFGKWEESRQYYKKAYEINNDEAEYKRNIALTYNDEGNAYYSNQQYNQAIQAYNKAIEHSPTEAVFYSNIGLALKGLGKWEESRQYFQKTYEINKEEAEYNRAVALVYNDEGNAYLSKQQYNQAIDTYTKAIEHDPTEPVFYSNMGLPLRSLGKWEESRQYYQKAYEINKDEVEYKRNIALAYNDEGNVYIGNLQFTEATEAYNKAVENDPSEAVFYSNIGLALRGLGKWEESRQFFRKAFEINNEEAEYNRSVALAYNDEGNAYYANQQYNQAMEAYSKAVEHDPSEAVFYSNVGLALRGLGKWEESRQYYQQAYEINNDEAEYNRAIALTYNAEGNEFYTEERYQEAIEYYLKAIDHDPSDAVYYSNVALSYNNLENWQEAINYYEKALERDEGNEEYSQGISLARISLNLQKITENPPKGNNHNDEH